MVYQRKSRRSFKKKSYKKKSYKKFSKKFNNKTTLKVNSLVVPHQTYTKMRWVGYSTITPAASSSFSLGVNGTGIYPLLLEGPSTTVGAVSYTGAPQFGRFYGRYHNLGTKIKIQVISQTSGDIQQVILLPISCNPSGMSAMITYLDTKTYTELIQYPGAKYRLLSTSGNSNNMCYLSGFAKTKNIMGITNIKDADDLDGVMPDPQSDNPEVTSAGSNPTATFMWYFRIFNISASASALRVNISLKGYFHLYQRNFIVPYTIPA